MKKTLFLLLCIGSFASAIETVNIENGNVTIADDYNTELYFKLESITKMYTFFENGRYKFNVALSKERDEIQLQRKENFIKLRDAFLKTNNIK